MYLQNGMIGVVSEIDTALMKAKVTEPTGSFVSKFLPILSIPGIYFIPKINQNVYVVFDKNYINGIIVGSVYNVDTPAPDFDDERLIGFQIANMNILIDIDTGDVSIDTNGSVTVLSTEVTVQGDNITLKAEKVIIDAELTVKKEIKAEGKITASSTINATGIIKSNSDVQTATVKLNSHLHVGAAPGSPTSPPTPGT